MAQAGGQSGSPCLLSWCCFWFAGQSGRTLIFGNPPPAVAAFNTWYGDCASSGTSTDKNGVPRESYSAPSWLCRHRLDFECFRRFIPAASSALNRTGAVKKEETGAFHFTHDYRDRSSAISALEEILRVCHRSWCSFVYILTWDFERTTYK